MATTPPTTESNSGCHIACPVDLQLQQIPQIRWTHSQGPCTSDLLRSSASTATRRSLTIQLSNPEVRAGREKKRFETGFPKVRTQKSLLSHLLKDEAATSCLSSSPQMFCQCRSYWHLLLSASIPLCSVVKSQEVLKLLMVIGNQIPP